MVLFRSCHVVLYLFWRHVSYHFCSDHSLININRMFNKKYKLKRSGHKTIIRLGSQMWVSTGAIALHVMSPISAYSFPITLVSPITPAFEVE